MLATVSKVSLALFLLCYALAAILGLHVAATAAVILALVAGIAILLGI